jgi:hypothetical protein
MPRPRIYRNNAEKLRIWRAKKKLKEEQSLYGGVHGRVTISPDDREVIKTTNPELVKVDKPINPEQLKSLGEFEDWLEKNSGRDEDYSWECPVCHTYNSLLRNVCRHCSEPISEEYQEQIDIFLELYPTAKRFMGE